MAVLRVYPQIARTGEGCDVVQCTLTAQHREAHLGWWDATAARIEPHTLGGVLVTWLDGKK